MYHADTGIFEPYKDIPAPMTDFCATKVGPSKIFIYKTRPPPRKSWLFDIDTEQFSEVPNNAEGGNAVCGTITLADGTQVVLAEIDSDKFGIFSPITMQWRDGPLFYDSQDGFNVGTDFYVRGDSTRLWKFNVTMMEFEDGVTRNFAGLFLSAVVPIPASFAVCT